MCNYCRFFHAISEPCGVCNALHELPVVSVKAQETIAPLAVIPKPLHKVNLAPILASLKADGMDTDSKIADGLRTGRVVQAISWQVNYLHIIDYLVSKGYDVGKYRYRVVCGSLAA
jgi:hypothetical protein